MTQSWCRRLFIILHGINSNYMILGSHITLPYWPCFWLNSLTRLKTMIIPVDPKCNAITWAQQHISPPLKTSNCGSNLWNKLYFHISKTSAVVQVLNRFVNKALMQHFEVNNAFIHSQHGFRTEKYVHTKFLQKYDYITIWQTIFCWHDPSKPIRSFY